jgi:hypothetical protein
MEIKIIFSNFDLNSLILIPMKKIFIILILGFYAFSNTYGQSKEELIKQLFKVMHQDSLIDKTFNNMLTVMLKQVQTEKKDPAEIAKLQERIKTEIPVLKDILGRMMDEDMVPIYSKYFTGNEIRDYIAFYQSPSGQKFINNTPYIQKDLMEVMYQKYIPEIQKAVKEKMEEINKNESK